MINSETLDEIEKQLKTFPKVGPFVPKIFNSQVEELISEIRKFQEREAAFRSALKHYELCPEPWHAREVLQQYPEEKKESGSK